MLKNDTFRQYLTLASVILMLVVNGLANAIPFNGLTTGEISDRFPVYFVPAGYVFSIWGLIYLGLAAFAVYQMLPAQRENPRLRKVGYLFVLSGIMNSIWLFLWHYQLFVLSLLVMVGLLVLLIMIYLRLGIGIYQPDNLEKWCLHIPVSIYLGWITVATIANATDVLYYLEWNGWGFSPEAWGVILLSVGVLIAAAISFSRGDIAYLLVIMWAYAGIAVKHATVPMIAASAWASAVVVLVVLIAGYVYHRRHMTGVL